MNCAENYAARRVVVEIDIFQKVEQHKIKQYVGINR